MSGCHAKHEGPHHAEQTDGKDTPTSFRYDDNPMFDRVVLAYAFRPFFIAASVYTILSVLAWAAFWFDILPLPETIAANHWHAHEMLYGFVTAALCGFLLTAVPEWTGTAPKTGRWVAGLLTLWLAGRVAMWFIGFLPIPLVAAINLALLPILAAWTIPALLQDHTRRQRAFIPILPSLWIIQLIIYGDWAGWLTPDNWAWTQAANWGEDLALRALNASLYIYLVAIVLVVMRVAMVLVPLALEEQNDDETIFRPMPPRRNLAIATLCFAAIADFIIPDNAITGWIMLSVAAAMLDILSDFHAGRALLKPYVMALYTTILWAAAGFTGLGIAILFDWGDMTAFRHALSLGATGTAIMAVFMVAGLRHTGRDVIFGPRRCLAFVLITLATGLRVISPVLWPETDLHLSIGMASLIWALAFLLYLVDFTRLLITPRADGQPG